MHEFGKQQTNKVFHPDRIFLQPLHLNRDIQLPMKLNIHFHSLYRHSLIPLENQLLIYQILLMF